MVIFEENEKQQTSMKAVRRDPTITIRALKPTHIRNGIGRHSSEVHLSISEELLRAFFSLKDVTISLGFLMSVKPKGLLIDTKS